MPSYQARAFARSATLRSQCEVRLRRSWQPRGLGAPLPFVADAVPTPASAPPVATTAPETAARLMKPARVGPSRAARAAWVSTSFIRSSRSGSRIARP